VIPGAGAFELAAACNLEKLAENVKGKAKLAVLEFA
jgi:chaperonin GroEL (HSP60 family)